MNFPHYIPVDKTEKVCKICGKLFLGDKRRLICSERCKNNRELERVNKRRKRNEAKKVSSV